MPKPIGEPPVAAAYQLIVVATEVLALAIKVTEPASHLLAGVELEMVGAIVLIVAATAVLLVDKQPLDVMAPA